MAALDGIRVAFGTSMEGIERIELTRPWEAMEQRGAELTLVAPSDGEIQTYDHLDKATTFPVDATWDSIAVSDYDALVLPGGVANGDQLRVHEPATAAIKAFFDAGKPVSVICHAPWALIDAGVADGRVLTSFPTLKTDLRNAGATWKDEPVVVCDHGPNLLITSRKPDDLDEFIEQSEKAFVDAKQPATA